MSDWTGDDWEDEEDFDLPPDDIPRFAYEVAEAMFDDFAARQDAEFQRAWMKAKGMAALYAYADFYDGEIHPALAVSRGWEELQLAFTGRAEAFLSGAVLHLWNCLPSAKAERKFRKLVRKAFKAAELATPKDAQRLYLKKYRNAEIRDPDDGFTLDPVLPAQGVRLREWALSVGEDVDHVEEQLFWIEYADRSENDLDLDFEPSEGPSGPPPLRLLDGGKTSQGTDK